MATLCLTQEQWGQLRDAGFFGGDQVLVLVSPDMTAQAQADGLDLSAFEARSKYDCGGDPDVDVDVDVVTTPDHLFYQSALDDLAERRDQAQGDSAGGG